MIIECLKERIQEGIILAEKASGKNLSLPILNSILLQAKNKSLIIKATNLEIGLEIEIPAKVEEEGEIAVNAIILSTFLSNLQKENKLKITSDKGNIKINTELTSTTIKSLPIDDFPIIPKVIKGDSFEINSSDFINSLRSVVFASAISDIKPEIASVYIYKNSNEIIFVATDSFRLAEKKITLKEKIRDFSPIIIPFRNVNEIIRVFDRLNSVLKITSDGNQISFISDFIHLTSRIINGNYPDYCQIMPQNHKTEVIITHNDLINNLKIANIFSDKYSQIDFIIKSKENIFEVTALNQDIGENISQIITNIKGEDLTISFNVKYIIDCLSIINQKDLSLKFTSKDKPLLIQGVGDESFSYIVMPIRSKS
ncbi:MAG: DNA polymerase III subunit beta [Candidatus Paceibacterota bacterium]|jgi:DNA polymerase-3 subunit beta